MTPARTAPSLRKAHQWRLPTCFARSRRRVLREVVVENMQRADMVSRAGALPSGADASYRDAYDRGMTLPWR